MSLKLLILKFRTKRYLKFKFKLEQIADFKLEQITNSSRTLFELPLNSF